MAASVLTVLAAASTLLLLLTSQPWAVEGAAKDRYKLCLFACMECVRTWGKEQFNGELCANRCHLTRGASLDPTCASYFIRSSRNEEDAGGRPHLQQQQQQQQLQLQQQQQQLLQVLLQQGQQQNLHNDDPRHPPYGYAPAHPADPSGLTPPEQDRVQHCRRLCTQCPARIVSDRDPYACMFTCVSLPDGNILC